MQRQVFPKGRPADTAGFSDEPAATQSSVVTLDQRLDSLERQMSDLLRQSEENGQPPADSGSRPRPGPHRPGATARRPRATDDRGSRGGAGNRRRSAAGHIVFKPAGAETEGRCTPRPRRRAATAPRPPPTDPGEDAYSEGFHLWEAASTTMRSRSLRAFTAAYPKHRRASYANNLIGRSLLDKGDARGAAEALLANYRSNPSGERAPDSLFYLGQALMQLGQPGQACKAYAELDAVYGAKIRPDLKKLVPRPNSQAHCS